MLLDLFIKIWVTPKNIFGLILEIMAIVAMCLIFVSWKEKWWKSLVPIYGTYVIYKHIWGKHRWLFCVPIILNIVGARCRSYLRKNLVGDVFDAIKTYIDTKEIIVDVNVGEFAICILVFLFSTLVSFIITRVTYLKICDKLCIKNALLKAGTFFFPQVFLLVDYIVYKKNLKDTVPRSVA